MYNYDTLDDLLNEGKEILSNDFGYVFIEKIQPIQNENISQNQNLDFLKIENKIKPIYKNITSKETLKETINLINENYQNFIDNFLDLWDRVEDLEEFSESDNKAFSIIEGVLEHRKKRMEGALKKFELQENISKTQEEFFYLLQNHLEDIIKSLLNSILIGLKRNSLYQSILTDFNKFLATFGIYTYNLEEGIKINENEWELINPIECNDCETNDETKRDVIKRIIFYPYLIEDKVILSGDINLWKVVKNG